MSASHPPTLDDVFAVISAASVGDTSARVAVPADPDFDDGATRVAIGLNVLLDDLTFRIEAARGMAARLGILADATRDFFEGGHERTLVLEAIARRLATTVKDTCTVLLVSSDGRELLPAAIHGPEDVIGAMRGYFATPFLLGEHPVSQRVHETGEPFLAPRLDINHIRQNTTPSSFAFVNAIGMHSLLIVALRTRQRVLGQLVLWRYRPESGPFGAHDLDLASGLAGHASLAIDSARAQEELRASEDQLRQSQKMEAVGRLAGGVAHDFNNILSVIIGYSEGLLREPGQDDRTRADIEQIYVAGKRAAGLTRQLLMFSRRQVLDPKVLFLNDILEQMAPMLRRILGEDVDLSFVLAARGHVRADSSSIEQVVLNLVVNARDAMPKGGRLTVETQDVDLDEAYVRTHLSARVGPHVALIVTDNGVGIDRATQARLFEPFFTTKKDGKGTGLGLSTVFGIVHQCEGSVWVYSEPGRGATFKVYLPRVGPAAVAPSSRPRDETGPAPANSRETILLVEDDDQVRAAAMRILQSRGYRVLAASGGEQALAICETYDGTIHLLLADVVMPKMSGPDLAKRVVGVRSATRVLLMSGYTEDGVVRHGVAASGVAYLEKPLTTEMLARKVREVIDGN